jgi:tRNA/tmRNA/rRNA uracil-C5-methylase (TrmA/RlmC/RlmD family)
VIIESIKQCIDAADINIKENNVKNAKTIVLDAKQLKKVELKKPLFVITDPPRSGMHPKTIEQLKNLKPEVIIYISCNIQQLGKDLLKFKDYKIKSAALFDLFPQTPHIEAVVEMVKV